MAAHPLIIVGAGPAGMSAAIEAARAGLPSIILDEAQRAGGQIYRQPPASFSRADPQRADREAVDGDLLRNELIKFHHLISARSQTAVIGATPRRELFWTDSQRSGQLTAEQLILATGAYDRPVPFPGWTLPGVLTAGGAQSFMKAFGVRPGDRAIVAGTGPLLMVVALQLHKAGVQVLALLEAGRPRPNLRSAIEALRHPALLKDAASYLWQLQKAGIPVLYNHTVFHASGKEGVERVSYGPVDEETWSPKRDQATSVDADLLVAGFGFVPNSELATLAGCEMEYRHLLGGWVPVRDEEMRTKREGVFAIGDGAGVGGVLVSVEEGKIAGITAAEQAGKLTKSEADHRRAEPKRKLAGLARIRALLDEMSAIRPGLLELATPEVLVCRCEEVTRAQVDAALAAGAGDLQAIKLACRLGMGACQGRNCAPPMALLLAKQLGKPVEQMGRINPRQPIKPILLGALAKFNSGSNLASHEEKK